jgi:hypothetical protein
LSHAIGLALLLAAVPALSEFTALSLASFATAVLVAVAVLERVFLGSRAAAQSGVN